MQRQIASCSCLSTYCVHTVKALTYLQQLHNIHADENGHPCPHKTPSEMDVAPWDEH